MSERAGDPLQAWPRPARARAGDAAQPAERVLHAAGRACAGAAMLVGAAGLVLAWTRGADGAGAALPVYMHMTALTGAALVVAGAALQLLHRPLPAWRRSSGGALAGLLLLLGTAVAAEYLFDLRLPLETALLPRPAAGMAGPSGRLPAPNTVVAVLLTGAAILALAVTKGGVRAAQLLALGAGFVALQAVVGYSYGVEPLYRMFSREAMSLPTAVGFLLLSVAVLSARPDSGLAGQLTAGDAGGFVARRLLPAALLVPLLLGWAALHAIRAGLVPLSTGLAFLAVAAAFTTAGVVWASTRALSSADVRRRAAGQAARELADRLQQAVELAPLPMAVHAEDGAILQISRSWRTLSGYGLQEIPTMQDWTSRAHGADAPKVQARIATLFDMEERFAEEAEYTVRTKDGGRRTWSFSSAPLGRLPDGRRIVITAAVDVTERAQAERQLRRSNERLEFLFQATSRLLASSDPGDLGAALYSELSALLDLDLFLSYAVATDSGQRYLRLLTCAGLDAADAERLQRVELGETPCGTAARYGRRVVLEDVGTSTHPLAASARQLGLTAYVCHPIVVRAEVAGTISFGTRRRTHFEPDELDLLQAVADQVAVATERARAYRAEQHARTAAEEASRAKDQFLAVVSHELRTPLTAVVGYTDLLQADVQGTLSPVHRGYVGRIRESAWSLAAVIDEILTFARTRAGHEHVKPEPVDVGQVAAEALAAVGPEADRKGLRLAADLPPAPVQARTDGAKLRRILLNLLGNAVKFTEAGTVSLRLREGDGTLRLQVEDTGPGIPAEYLERIFDPFIQVDASETRTQSGTGLGLTITRELAHLLGGTVAVASTPGSGSTFTVELPAVSRGSGGDT
jgi:PAS domain S-box-containing protein